MLRLASDADVHGEIIRGLRRRQPEIDLVRAQDALPEVTPDPEILAWAAAENRVLVTNDRNTMIGFAYQRVAAGEPVPGVIATTNQQSIGSAIDDILRLRTVYAYGGRLMNLDVQYFPPDGLRDYERWQRLADDTDISGVEVVRTSTTGPWQWSVTVEAMEYIREDLLETEIRRAMAAELQAVPGVERISEEDREVWVVDGSPSGEELTRAAANVVDRFAERIREYCERQGLK